MLAFRVRNPRSLLLLLVLATVAPPLAAQDAAPPLAAQDDAPPLAPQDLVGSWVFAKDLSPPRAGGQLRPNQGVRFVASLADEVLALEQMRPGGEVEHVRIALDGSPSALDEGGRTKTTSGRFQDGVLVSEVRKEPAAGSQGEVYVSQYTYRRVPEGLAVRMQMLEPLQVENESLYMRAEDIPHVEVASARLEQIAWLAGAWTGTMGTLSIEERWSPPGGGAMLAISRTIKGQRMIAFEYLRIVERDGGLVYIAQPNGYPPTEFVLTLIEDGRAVFVNALHDFPQRIEYARQGAAGLRATISDLAGENAQSFEFEREGP